MLDGEFVFGNCRSGHDWAIVEVEQPLTFGVGPRIWNWVRPICLPSLHEEIQNVLTVTGWGRPDSEIL